MPLKTRITNVRHCAETGCFEADVTVIDGTDCFTYAVAHSAPIDTDTSLICAALSAQARAQHQPASCTLTRRRVSESLAAGSGDIAKDILFSRPNYLEQILGRQAGGAMREA
ncbi:MAG: hypothetical protein EP318_09310 [Rhodobacteraceae bacterium]|nr:MAG: hypothetical protein EP318_09310 [Paracoccaceae bacterium]